MNLQGFVAELRPRDLAYDTRSVTPGALFFCVPGERADGHDFAAEAAERGAVGLVVERRLDHDVPPVFDTRGRRASARAAGDGRDARRRRGAARRADDAGSD